jgi:predicted  nucleic acid-binding Zn-ribbon protein
MMLVADYLLEKLSMLAPGKYDLNMQRVYQLMSYHDLIEAET